MASVAWGNVHRPPSPLLSRQRESTQIWAGITTTREKRCDTTDACCPAAPCRLSHSSFCSRPWGRDPKDFRNSPEDIPPPPTPRELHDKEMRAPASLLLRRAWKSKALVVSDEGKRAPVDCLEVSHTFHRCCSAAVPTAKAMKRFPLSPAPAACQRPAVPGQEGPSKPWAGIHVHHIGFVSSRVDGRGSLNVSGVSHHHSPPKPGFVDAGVSLV